MIYVIGSIGAGKSTLTRILSADMGVPSYYEDINNGLIKGTLEEFYSAGAESRIRVAGMLQVAFLTFRYQQLKRAVSEKNAILDSSLLSDSIMENNLYKRGEISKSSHNVYTNLNQTMQGNVNGMPFNGLPDIVIFIDISKEHEIDSIQARGRDIEDISKDPEIVDYYGSVNQSYKNWYKGYVGHSIKVDRDKVDFVHNLDDRAKVLDMIESKLVEIGKLTEAEFKRIKEKRQFVDENI